VATAAVAGVVRHQLDTVGGGNGVWNALEHPPQPMRNLKTREPCECVLTMLAKHAGSRLAVAW
jgi:hypothetical protein